jgi:hypothetical protein
MQNPSFQRSIDLLARPLSLAALGVLLLNDHFLRIYYPSWVTGKLGDFAWLYFSPFVLAALLSQILPGILGRRPGLTISLSAGLITLVFGLANTSPAAAGWMANQAGRLLGMRMQIHCDPYDLVGLSACALACWRWKESSPAGRPPYRLGWLLIGLSAVLTLANSAMPDYGVVCLWQEQGRLIAGTNNYQRFESRDGGLTWVGSSERAEENCDLSGDWSFEVAAPENDLIRFRNEDLGQLQESRDGGKSWSEVQEFQPDSQAEQAWLRQTQSSHYQPGPYAAVADASSGRLVLAMGREGVLVREPGGQWLAAAVGDYCPVQLSPRDIPGLLYYEIWLVGAMALMVFLSPGIFSSPSLWPKIHLGLAWLAWLGTLTLLQPALDTGWSFLAGFSVPICCILVLVSLGIFLAQNWQRLLSLLPRGVLAALLGFLAGLLPFVFWALDWIPRYSWSTALALLLVGLVLAGSWRSNR